MSVDSCTLRIVSKTCNDAYQRFFKSKCENKMDRDINAAINIEWEGFLIYNKEQIV